MNYLRYIFTLIIFLVANHVQAQNYTDTEIQQINSNNQAHEGDMYFDTTNGIQYIGTTNGKLKVIGQNIFVKDGQISENRIIDGNQNNLDFSNLDSTKIESNTLEIEGNLVLKDITESGTVSQSLVIDNDGKIFSRPPSQAQSDIILIDPTPVSASGSGDNVIHDIVIPGGSLGSTNVVRVSMFMRRTSGSGNIQLKAFYNDDLVAQMPSTNGNNPAKTELLLFGAGTTDSQRAYIYHSNSGANGLGTSSSDEDSTVDQVLSIRANFNNNTVVWTCDFIMVEIIR